MIDVDHKTVWSECLEIIRSDVDAESYNTWFSPIHPLHINGDVLTVQVPSHFFYEWLEEHFIPVLKKAIKTVLGPTAKLEYSVVVDSGNEMHSPIAVNIANKPGHYNGNGYSPFAKKQTTVTPVEPRLNPNYTFSTFIEGDCNRLARTFGQTVAKRPGVTSVNPLMLYGRVGVGKTHLVQAIGNEIMRNFPDRKIIYVDANEFSNQFLNAARDFKIEEFQNYYLQADAIILEDVQHLEGREKTLEIFFNIFNQMHQSQKQILITSDKPATMLKNIPERLVSRFKWGLTADIQEADFETKLAIIHTKISNDGVDIPKEVVEYLALSVDTNLRDMEGVLNSLLLHSTLLKRTIDLDLARDVMKNIIKEIQTDVSVDYIQKTVAEAFQVNVELLKQKVKKREIVIPRQVAMYFCKRFTQLTLALIGQNFGGRDHSTVIHALESVEDLMKADVNFKNKVDDLLRKFKSRMNS